ncbi:MAG: hypothetical protein FWH41_02415 [Treponema sp.]|nr:hypothetical protein [Treponema sp.]
MKNINLTKPPVYDTLKKSFHSSLAPLLIAIYSLLICNCDLFNNSKDPHFIKKIDEEIAWANAAKLNVAVAVPSGWGISPQLAGCKDAVRTNESPRKGYTFNVEFTPNAGYGFIEWLAFNSSTYSLQAVLDMENFEEAKSKSLNGQGVDITDPEETYTGAFASTVKINVNAPVMLIPYCDMRPRLERRTNPPLNPISTLFPRNQTINLWFTMPIKQETVLGNIRISAVHSSDENRFGKKTGELFGENGDITDYFGINFPSANRIDLTPLDSAEYPVDDLALLGITVEVGPGIESANEIPMGVIETITYQTGIQQAQKAYKPGLISVSRTAASGYFDDTIPWNRPDIDRRFNQIATGQNNYNTAYIKFSVTPPADAPSQTPNRITVIEKLILSLRGFNASGAEEYEYKTSDSEVSYNIGTGEYTITHKIETASSGIIQLLALPWYFDDDEALRILPLMPENAAAAYHFVTIVMDTEAPDFITLNALNASLSPHASQNEGVLIYGQTTPLTLTLGGLRDLADNGSEGGILSSYSLPWTMDPLNELFWYAQIGEDNQPGKISSERLNINDAMPPNNQWMADDISTLELEPPYSIYVKFEDRMGNATEWKETGFKIKYSDEDINSVSDIKAVCNTAGNMITVSWSAPLSYQYPELVIRTYSTGTYGDSFESERRIDFNKEKANGYSFTVPQINTEQVLEGEAVSGIYGYEISVITHNVAGNPLTGPVWVYNIPDMATTGSGEGEQSNTVRLTSSNIDEVPVSGSGTSGKNYVLTRDITITGTWTPIGSSTNAFQGNFYGNGHTITFSGSFDTSVNYAGIFGYISGAQIRDLSVYYPAEVNADHSLTTGGLAAYALEESEIRNCIVGGPATAALKVTSDSTEAVYLGGMVGRMGRMTAISHSYAYLNIALQHDGSGDAFTGGLVGDNSPGETISKYDWFAFNNIYSAGEIICKKNNTQGDIYAGGIVGYLNNYTSYSRQDTGALSNAVYSGSLEIERNSSGIVTGNLYAGGFSGYAKGSVYDCKIIETFLLNVEGDNSKNVYTGGIIGFSDASELVNIIVQGEIKVSSAGSIYAGGLEGFYNGGSVYNSISENGSISVTSLSSGTEIYLGGVVGYALDGWFTDCHSLYNYNVSAIPMNGCTVKIGGFAGVLKQSFTEECSRTGWVSISSTNSDVYLGGFTGTLEAGDWWARLYKCSVSHYGGLSYQSLSNGNMYIGGLVGYSEGAQYTTVINQCQVNYSSDSNYIYNLTVTNSSTTKKELYTGGLVGYSYCTDIEESFANLNITVSGNNNTDKYTGGISGYLEEGSIKNCYVKCVIGVSYSVSMGGVSGKIKDSIVQHNISLGSVFCGTGVAGLDINSGGIVGETESSAISGNIALVSNVVASGNTDVTKTAARIYASPASGGGTNNFALKTMTLGTSSSFSWNFNTDVALPTTSNDPDSPNGKDADLSDLVNINFWLDENGLAFNRKEGVGGIEGMENIWDFSTLTGRGYPALAWE